MRHTLAHVRLAQGGNEGDLMRLAGWRSRAILKRYAVKRYAVNPAQESEVAVMLHRPTSR